MSNSESQSGLHIGRIVYPLAVLLGSRLEFLIQDSNHLNEEWSLFIQFFPGVGGSLL